MHKFMIAATYCYPNDSNDSICPIQRLNLSYSTDMKGVQRDASMVCPCRPQATHRARNMEAVQRKEHDSTCLQSV